MEALDNVPENMTVATWDQYMDAISPTWGMWTLVCLSVVVFIVGLTGNALVCAAVYRNRSMRTVTNYFIMNLAIADFMVILFCLPPSVAVDVTMTWFFGNIPCKVVVYLQTVSVTVSVLTLTFISIERWYAICFPLKFKSTTARAKAAIAIIWIIAFAIDIPELVSFSSKPHSEARVNGSSILLTQCNPDWSSNTDQIWSMIKMVFLYLVPLGVMAVTYYRIISVLRRSSTQPCDISENSQLYSFSMSPNANTRGPLRSRRKAAKMLVSVVVMFAVCFLPVHIIEVLRPMTFIGNDKLTRTFSFASHWLCYANSAMNPLIYNFMSGKFRKEFKRSFDCCSATTRRRRQELRSFNHVGSLTKSRTSSRLSQQRSGSLFKRTDTVTSRITD